MLSVPVEIWELIIDNVRFQASTLGTLSLVSRSCTRRARYYLFRTAIVRSEGDYERLLSVLDGTTYLRDAVRRLFLDGASKFIEGVAPTEFWVDRALERLPCILYHVDAFRISYPEGRYLPPGCLTNVFPSISELVLAHCCFATMDDLFLCMLHHQKVSRLTVSGVTLVSSRHPQVAAPQLGLLRYLEFDCKSAVCVPVFEALGVNVTNLYDIRVVRLDNATSRVAFVGHVLETLGLSLTHLRIHTGKNAASLHESRVLTHLTTMTSLMIEMSVHTHGFLHTILTQVRSPKLDTLIIRHLYKTTTNNLSNDAWMMLAKTLESPFFVNLRKVQWVIQPGIATSAVEEIVRSKLRVTRLNPIISCVSEDDFVWERP